MKVCLLLQRRFVYVGHSIAIFLKEQYGVSDFCAYVYRRQGLEYLLNQRDVTYCSLLLDDDIHKKYKEEKLDIEYLKYLEKEFGIPNLWPYVEIDRVIRYGQLVREYPYNTSQYSHEDMMKMVQVRAKAIIEFFEKEKPDVFICSVVGGMGSMLLYYIAKKMGIKVYVIVQARVGSRYMLSEHYSYFTEVEKRFNNLKELGKKSEKYGEAQKIIDEFRKKPITYEKALDFYKKRATRLSQMDFLSPRKLKNYFIWLYQSIKSHLTSPEVFDYTYIHPWGKIKDQVKRKLRNIRGVSDLYDSMDMKEDFAYFPLHLEPEISTMLFAPFHVDQLHIIRQVARSLPLHYKLYVKEQPAMVDFRTRGFYKELKKIPNVKLISPQANNYDIISGAKLIITITGTTGWEGLFLKKPVICFGDIYYNKLSMVKKCGDIEQLPYLVKQQLENFKYNEEELINFLACILEDSVDVDLTYLWEKEKSIEKKNEGLIPLSRYIAQKLNLKKK